MRRHWHAVLSALVAASLAGTARGAEGPRLRPVTAVYEDSKGVALRSPEGVACNGESLVVADSGNGRVAVFEVAGDLLASRQTFALPELPYPVRVAFRSDGGLLVLDGRARRIARVSARGAFEGWLDIEGPGGVTPRSVKVGPDGRVYVLDARSARVLVLDAGGHLARQVPLPKEVRFPADLAVTSRGELIVVDGVGGLVLAASEGAASATVLATLPRDDVELAHSIAVDAGGRLFVVDRGAGRIAVFGGDGAPRGAQLGMGWGQGQLRYPGAVCIDPRSLVYVADRENNRVQVYSIVN
jgi:DNA-binding beta-propeller fold protein YncE